jgi:LysM repeat protein
MHPILSLVLVVTLLATASTAAHSYHEAASAAETAANSLAAIDGQTAQQPPSPLGALHADEIACNGGEEPSEAEQEGRFQSSKSITGTKIYYTVKEGDSLRRIGAHFGVNGVFLARTNGLNPKKPLQPGQKLVINTRRIIPKTIRDGIVINIPIGPSISSRTTNWYG